MSIYKKLQTARHQLSKANLKKSGVNTYGGWRYYELADFIPTINSIFETVGLCGVFTFGETATLTIHDGDSDAKIVFSTPIVHAESNKGQPIQLLGSTHTYLRRYLWLMAMEIVEADSVDAAPQEEKPVKIPAKIEGKNTGEWQLIVTAEEGCTNEEWVSLVMDATKIMLETAASESDVTKIFKVNRNIFDKLKELNTEKYAEVLASFKSFKDSLKEK